MRKTRLTRIAAAAAASLALALGLATPARAAAVDFDCINSAIFHDCETYTGQAYHYSGSAGLAATDDGGWRVGVQPAGGFTLYLRVWPTSSRYIDYPASQDGRVLYYDIYAIQIVVSGHQTSQRIFL